MKEILLQWLGFTGILAVFIFGMVAIIFKVGDLIDEWRAKRKENKENYD